MTKPARKTNFIQALSSGTSLDSLDTTNTPKSNQETINNEDYEINDISKVEETENVGKPDSKAEVSKKVKPGKNNKEFVENLISNFKNNTEPTKEKSSLHITPELHYKLKMLAFSTKVNLLDLTNAIIHSYLEQNKENIDTVVKKLSI